MNYESRHRNMMPKLTLTYSNPFKAGTTIKFSIPEVSDVRLLIYNSNVRLIQELFQGHLGRGFHSFKWDGRNTENIKVGSGIYYYVLKTKDRRLTKKMLLIQ